MKSKIIASATVCATIAAALLAKPWDKRRSLQASGPAPATEEKDCPGCGHPGTATKHCTGCLHPGTSTT
ncbi:hypothetical protein HLK59_03435 [Streptomyces sp. S3(2020)]|uniref:hypothetical protein n=1 Tax=Streptomyces sp. S3(2020) TaxID=2732044 RepID=UPI0014881033|nr:hypothetical protein [Streptomyces sp. S3(2020)]NNN29421.1 hypothetical protein [Streptomyces sp. S3(2020)]